MFVSSSDHEKGNSKVDGGSGSIDRVGKLKIAGVVDSNDSDEEDNELDNGTGKGALENEGGGKSNGVRGGIKVMGGVVCEAASEVVMSTRVGVKELSAGGRSTWTAISI